jgi:hypothetical protein
MYDPERLRFYMERRIETTMIGALARIEENLGYLWGHNKDGDLTEKEEHFADVWEFTRNQILNHGNQQMRNLKEDFHKYGGVFKNQYHYSFKVNNNNQTRKDN